MSRFMEHIHIGRFGVLEDYQIGPFERGLNVVYGPNEAGKSTIASFVGGVLFGWEEAHGVRNTYSPATGERSGALAFSDGTVASRENNEDGLKGDARPTSDIDSATFKTMFSLTSDELRSLRNSSDVTARLLTAGSGTGTSPAGAFVEIEQRIAALTSRSLETDGSISNLAERLDAEHELVKELGDEAERRIREDWELKTLQEDREITARHLSDVNREIEKLGSSRDRIERIDAQVDEAQAELSALEVEYSEHVAEQAEDTGLDRRLMLLDNVADRSLRDKLDEYADEQAKATRGVDIAKENAAASSAAYEALMEMDTDSPQVKRARASKTSLAVLPALLALAFALAGVPVFVHARAINSLSLTALGIGLIVFACLLAVTTVALVARPDRTAEALDARKQDAQWVMLQDKKKLDTSLAAKQLLDDEVKAFLEEKGLAAANGSIRQARSLLDDAREARSDMQARNQRLASLERRIETNKQTIESLI
ncbi:MAG: AAA family ATPase, partial [Eggerthellaceae bacterium]|nr:AAA family ATPase [Eggerthellaceae bacterium]